MSGILMNDPHEIPGLESGAQVGVDEEALFDYTHYLPDGSVQGNETGQIFQRRLDKKKN